MSVQRGIFGGLFDSLITRLLGLPPETCTYTTTSVRIPVADSSGDFELAADLYQPVLPKDTKPAGTILVRSPYGRGLMFAFNNARPFAARGYQVLFVSSRGTFGSGGSFVPWNNEEIDGQAVVAWMRQQPWYTGSFATLGSSYLGFTQWALLRNPPDDMVAAIILVAPHNLGEQIWGTGAFPLDWLTWTDIVAHQEETGFAATLRKINTPKRLKPVLDSSPLEPAIAAHFQATCPWFQDVLNHSDPTDRFYEGSQFEQALDKADLPILLVGGWYDVFLRQTIEQYTRLSNRNCNVALTLGPWRHRDAGIDGITLNQTLQWLDVHLARRGNDERKAPVHYYMTGAKKWNDAPKWPPTTTPHVLYLNTSKALSHEMPDDTDTSSTLTLDPRNLTPAIGGNMLVIGGSADDTILADRPDVLIFTTEPIESDMDIVGKAVVELSHSSNDPNAHLFVRISEVDANDRSKNITETYKKLSGKGGGEPVILTLNDCAHRVAKGHRIRLIIAGASHPQYAMDVSISTSHTVYHDSKGSSKVLLPILT
ncbi:hypothetical protein NW762_005769 [Fusarium torreyae]|uniref:Xaa-Pro dipeptidyl-peptidase C-terminal domain-containing protein n=1 Tax=Fusarium torreyae TaxID=1237075 RepID=A0A9W8S3F2_9HYPO|nr:hypothetical protein NW762_005769 [Fusarium torreyae]